MRAPVHVLQGKARSDRCAQRPLAVNVVGFESGAIRLDEESANAILFVFHLCPDDRDVGDRAGGDPHLLAVDDVLIADFAGAGAHAAGIRSEIGLSQTEAAELLAFLHRRQPGFFLLVAAKFVDRIHAQIPTAR